MESLKKTKLDLMEERLMNEEKELEKKQAELDQLRKKIGETNCDKQCANDKIPIGGLKEGKCDVNNKDVKCTEWDDKLATAINPECLQKCVATATIDKENANKLSGEISKLKSAYDKYKRKVQIAGPILKGIEAVKKLLSSIMDKIKDTLNLIKNAVKELLNFLTNNFFYLEYFCMSFELDKLTSYIFEIDGVVYPGGKQDVANKKVIKERMEIKSTATLLKEVAAKIAQYAYPQFKKLRKNFVLFKSKSDEFHSNIDDLKKKNKEGQQSVDEILTKERSGIENSTYSIAINTDIPSFVTRADRTVLAFREVYEDRGNFKMISDEEENAAGRSSNTTMPNVRGFLQSTNKNKCNLTKDILDTYNAASNCMGLLMTKNEEAKDGYTKYMDKLDNSLYKVKKQILEQGKQYINDSNWKNDALYFVNYGRDENAKLRSRYDDQYDMLEQSSLRHWRNHMKRYLQDRGMDVETFLSNINTAAETSSATWEVPNARNDVRETMVFSNGIMRSMLNSKGGRLSDYKRQLATLKENSQYIKGATDQLCAAEDATREWRDAWATYQNAVKRTKSRG